MIDLKNIILLRFVLRLDSSGEEVRRAYGKTTMESL